MKKPVTIGLGAVFTAAMAFAQNAATPPAGSTTSTESGAAEANGVNRTGNTDSSAVQIQSQSGSVNIPDTRTYEAGHAGYAQSGHAGASSQSGATRQSGAVNQGAANPQGGTAIPGTQGGAYSGTAGQGGANRQGETGAVGTQSGTTGGQSGMTRSQAANRQRPEQHEHDW